MARNAPDSGSSRESSRVTQSPRRQPVQATRSRRDRRQFWIQIVAAFLVLMMLLPVVAFFF